MELKQLNDVISPNGRNTRGFHFALLLARITFLFAFQILADEEGLNEVPTKKARSRPNYKHLLLILFTHLELVYTLIYLISISHRNGPVNMKSYTTFHQAKITHTLTAWIQ